MKITGGIYNGRELKYPKGPFTRPTADKVRESILGILGGAVEGANVADLYAGSGAMGIEAISRGASTAVFVDSALEAIRTIRENLDNLVIADADRKKMYVDSWLKSAESENEVFDLIFFDPPYDKFECEVLDRAAGILAANGLIVAEFSSKMTLCPDLKNLKVVDERKYGDTAVAFLKPK